MLSEVTMPQRPRCIFCQQNGYDVPATLLAAQSEDQGQSVSWVPICNSHADGWNDDGGDWDAPIYVLVERRAFDALAARLPVR